LTGPRGFPTPRQIVAQIVFFAGDAEGFTIAHFPPAFLLPHFRRTKLKGDRQSRGNSLLPAGK
jgi:hypothetical protein